MLLLLCLQTKGQVNYVQNSSFEQYSQCPDNYDEINYCNYWSSIDSAMIHIATSNAIPEYCNACADSNTATETYVGVPQSGEYYHYPHSGNGMALVRVFWDSANASFQMPVDYLQGRLYHSLTAGTSYCVTFYVTMSQASGYAVNNIGAYLDNGIIDTAHYPASPQTQYVPQIHESNVINDTLNWNKIEGKFTADGTEQFITIGNFFPNDRMSVVVNSSGSEYGFGYYLVDDVSVVESDLPAYAGNDTSIQYGDTILIGRNEEALDCKWYVAGNLIDSGAGIHVHPDTTTTYVVAQTVCGLVKYDTCAVTVWPLGVNDVKSTTFAIYPNPASNGTFTIETSPGPYLSAGKFSKGEVVVYDMYGRCVYSGAFSGGKKVMELHVSSGVYMVSVAGSDGERVTKQVIVNP